MSTKNPEIVDLLQRIGDLLELHGEESFKARAYREAARQLDQVPEDVEVLAAEGRLTDVKGVGSGIARTIEEYLRTGQSRQLEHLRAQVPESLVELLGLRHFGPSRIVKVHQALGISSLDELEAAARDGRLESVPGFAKKSVEALLASIAGFRQRRTVIPRYVAQALGDTVVYSLRQMASLERVALVGSIRRGADTVANVDVLAATDEPHDAIDAFGRLSVLRDVTAAGRWQATAATRERQPVRLWLVPPALWGQGVVRFTGSVTHWAQLVGRARDAGLPVAEASDVTEDGIWSGFVLDGHGRARAADGEDEVYRWLGLPCIPSELREGAGEVAAAAEGTLPQLVELADIRGDLHVHTVWSDGRQTVEQMARKALALGYDYLAIADHSQSLGVARGLSLDRLQEQRQEIARVDAELAGIRLLSSVELDIKRDGTLDYPDEVLAGFDFVTASIHSGFQQSGEQLTERVVRAMRSPYVDSIGHLTGRVLGWRDPLEMDVDRILAAAAETGTALEINAWPNRLDVDDRCARRAKALGVKLVINTDSHAEDQLEYMHYGVELARRAWLEPADVLNAWPLDALRRYLAERPHKAPKR